ncbi:hypothetical protein L6R53_25620 [Myxococcota bacterium]|nr:hypothetical protein [Myxococcota bacterium]
MLATILVSLLLAGPARAQVDSGTTDSGTTDSGTTDSGTTDSGTDGGTTDGGTTDGGTTDGGTADDTAAWIEGGDKLSDLAGERGGFGCEGSSAGLVFVGLGVGLLGLGRRRD